MPALAKPTFSQTHCKRFNCASNDARTEFAELLKDLRRNWIGAHFVDSSLSDVRANTIGHESRFGLDGGLWQTHRAPLPQSNSAADSVPACARTKIPSGSIDHEKPQPAKRNLPRGLRLTKRGENYRAIGGDRSCGISTEGRTRPASRSTLKAN